MENEVLKKMSRHAQALHDSAVVVDTHQEILDEYIYRFLENEEEAVRGDIHVFDTVYQPILAQQGVNLINMSVGGDHVPQVMYSASEFRFWDANKKLDILNTELEAGCTSFILCKTAADIDRTLDEKKIGIIATLSGGRPLEGKPNLNLLSSLRNLHRLGLRGIQLTGNNRNRLGDGVAQSRSRGRLTDYGIKVLKEAQRLKMIIDTAQLSDAGFFDLMENMNDRDTPVIDSHSCCSAIADHPRNISDDRIKAIAERGGVIGISFWAALISGTTPPECSPDGSQNLFQKPDETPVPINALMRHIDHIIEIAGIDHVALGPDYSAYQTPVDRDRVRGFANLGPDFTAFNRLTPVQSEKYPGDVEGIWYGIRKSDFVQGAETHEAFPLITAALLYHGYDEASCRKILGENMLRVYRQVLP